MNERINNPELFFIGGITGSGKTSITEEITRRDDKIKAIYGSKALMDYFGCVSYEEINTISEDRQRQARIEIFSNLRPQNQGKILFDGHYLIFTKNGEATSTVEPEWIRQFDMLIHLNANPHAILERLLSDPKNFRRRLVNLSYLNGSFVDKIQRTQDLSIREAESISRLTGVPLSFVSNSSTLPEAVNEIEQLIKK